MRSLCRALIFLTAMTQNISLTGRIADPQGGVVMNATVTLTAAGQIPLATRSLGDGTFTFELLRPGQYTIQVDAAGFGSWTQTVVIPAGAATVPLNVTLQIAGVNESINVVESAAMTLAAPSATGSRLNLPPLEVPASLQIVTGEVIRERGDVSLEEAESRLVGVTNLSAPGNGGGSRMARGFSGVTSVMRLYDGTQLFIGSGTVTFPFDPWTVDRIEVMGGPASVMYGNGAIGGVINVIPRKPNRMAFEHSARVTAGSNNTWRAALDTTGPINSRMAYRLDLSHIRSDGWVDRGESRSNALSASLAVEIRPDLHLTLSEDWGFQRPSKYFGTPLINGVFDPALRRANFNVEDANIYFKDSLSQAKAEWRPRSNLTVRSNFNMLRTNRFWHDVETYSYIPASDMVQRTSYLEIWHDQVQYGNHTEAVITNTFFGRQNTLSVGIDYDWVRFQHTNNSPNSNSSLVPRTNFSPGFFIPTPASTPQFRTYSHHHSEFFENRFVLNRYLSVIGGARVDTYDIDRRDLRAGGSAGRTFNPVNWRTGLVLSPRRNLAFYAQYATATDAVGTLLTLSPEQQLFDLTPGRQVEVGAKKSLWNGRAELTLAGYHIVKKKLLIPDPDNPLRQQQVGRQSSRGVEATLALVPVAGVRIEANTSMLHARFDEFRESVSGAVIVRDGNTPANIPQQTANVWVSWSFLNGWQAQTGVRYIGSRYLNTANTGTTPSYAVTDVSFRRRLTESMTVDVRGANIFDKLYLQSVTGSNTAPPSRGRVGAPRTFEISLTAKF
jgi:iron complex outermembrane recepter protein